MPDDAQRLQRLEENQAFAEHTVEQLSAELADVNRRLAEALVRLDRVERRLDRMASDALERPAESDDEELPESTG